MITNDKIVNGVLYKDVMEACLDLITEVNAYKIPLTYPDFDIQFDDDGVSLAFDRDLYAAFKMPNTLQVCKELASIIGKDWEVRSGHNMLADPYLFIELDGE